MLRKFRILTFFIATVIFCVMTFITLFAEAVVEEGTGGSGMSIRVLAGLYGLLRFPTHSLFMNSMNGQAFMIGLYINCLFYGFLTERLIFLSRRKKSVEK